MEIDEQTALIVVDVQKDFCPGGALPAPKGDDIIPVMNELIKKAQHAGSPIFFTRDWHPEHHCSFEAQGGRWPPHCIKRSAGAEFHPDLHVPESATIISKATTPDEEAYSGFDKTDLAERLRERGIERVVVAGLTTEYCVRRTVEDALEEGFAVFYVPDATAGVEEEEGDVETAEQAMQEVGATVIRAADVQV